VLERYTWFRQSAVRYADDELSLYIDPWGTRPEDRPADVILITHVHGDHFQPEEIARLSGPSTKLVAPHDVARELSGDVTAVAPGESHEVAGVRFSTVPAYNTAEQRLEAHPKENNWVGYLVELGGQTIYHSGDTDALEELKSITTDVAMVCIGGDPFTMGPEEAGDLISAMRPGLAVPMHYGFVVGEPNFADRFEAAAAPVPIQVLDPVAGWGPPAE
jgi:L-ascorbate metabolism protein UlaG (beta-lactamase superfamily)